MTNRIVSSLDIPSYVTDSDFIQWVSKDATPNDYLALVEVVRGEMEKTSQGLFWIGFHKAWFESSEDKLYFILKYV